MNFGKMIERMRAQSGFKFVPLLQCYLRLRRGWDRGKELPHYYAELCGLDEFYAAEKYTRVKGYVNWWFDDPTGEKLVMASPALRKWLGQKVQGCRLLRLSGDGEELVSEEPTP